MIAASANAVRRYSNSYGVNMTTAEILSGLTRFSALVVGDICLDRWCTYDPATSEPSRETGIPRIGVVATEVTPGGGGTVANNLASLRPKSVAVIGVRGDDGFGFELERALAERGITSSLMVKIPNWHTFTYTKVINSQNGEEDKPRVDFISTRQFSEAVESKSSAIYALPFLALTPFWWPTRPRRPREAW